MTLNTHIYFHPRRKTNPPRATQVLYNRIRMNKQYGNLFDKRNDNGQDKAHSTLYFASSISRTFAERLAVENGFWMNPLQP